jgi:hypothetical protein
VFLNWLRQRKKKKISKSAKQRKRNATWLAKYKANCYCERCSEGHTACLEFHHVGNKTITVSGAVRRGWSISRIMKEIAKCTVLCANCHRKEHYRET